MFLFICLCMTMITLYANALFCLSAKWKFDITANLLMAIFWPIGIPLAIYSIMKQTSDYKD